MLQNRRSFRKARCFSPDGSFWVSASSHLTWVRMLMILVKLERTPLDVGRNHWQKTLRMLKRVSRYIFLPDLLCKHTSIQKQTSQKPLPGMKVFFSSRNQKSPEKHLELNCCGPNCPRTLMLRVYSLASVKSRRCCKAATVSANSRLQQMMHPQPPTTRFNTFTFFHFWQGEYTSQGISPPYKWRWHLKFGHFNKTWRPIISSM